jgi:sialidase-1
MPLIIFLLLLVLPQAAAMGAPRFQQTVLFRQGEGGVHTYRIPALVETRRGVLIAVVDARHENSADLPGHISLVMRRSLDRGATWSTPSVIREVKYGGVGDASLLLDRRTGRVWCFFAYGPPGIGFSSAKPGRTTGPSTLQVHAMHSDDDGQSWTPPEDLTPQLKDASWQAVFATSGTHIQTAGGRYLVPLVVRDAAGVVSSRNAYSDDGGRAWRAGAAIGPGTDESHAVELNGGVILQNMRNGRTRAIARSTDGGATFGPVEHDAALIDPSCNAGIARYRRGRQDLLVFTNAAAAKRENLTVKISRDQGRTWPEARTIHTGPAAYSTVIQLRDGTLGVLYECGEKSSIERIVFARFDLEWIRENGR